MLARGKWLALGYLSLVSMAHCSAEAPPSEATEETTSQTSDAIKGGEKDTADTAVLGLFDMYHGYMCSGSLIAPNLVLTARHCVSDILDEVQGGVACGYSSFGTAHSAAGFIVTTRKDIFSNNPSDWVFAKEVVTLPVDDNDVCGLDQAMLILSENIESEKAIPYVPRVDAPIAAGEEYYAVGYGSTDDDRNDSGIRRRRDELFVDCVSEDCAYYTQVADSEWLGDEGICSGDSGGPALDLKNRVIGVTSRGASSCESPIYGYVYSWRDWIIETALRAAEEGGYDAPPWATGYPTDPVYSADVGTTCSGEQDCAGGYCLSDNGESYCSRPCTDVATCPDGYACQDVDGQSLCVGVVAKEGEGGSSEAEATPNKATADSSEGACSLRPQSDSDPTKPVPWLTGLAALLALRTRRRRKL